MTNLHPLEWITLLVITATWIIIWVGNLLGIW